MEMGEVVSRYFWEGGAEIGGGLGVLRKIGRNGERGLGMFLSWVLAGASSGERLLWVTCALGGRVEFVSTLYQSIGCFFGQDINFAAHHMFVVAVEALA